MGTDKSKDEILREELRKLKDHVKTDVRPVVYTWLDEETGDISFSAYKVDDPLYENNHMTVCEVRGGKVNKHSSVMRIVRNVLSDCGVNVIEDL